MTGRDQTAGAVRAHHRDAGWWERPWFLALLVAAAAIPLLGPANPPLVDLFGHMGRYRVELDLWQSPDLQRYYDFHWAAIGNLGVDLLVRLLAPALGLEPAVKLIVLAIPPLTVAGFLWVARQVHGYIPPTALFALPFAYSHPFMFGFVNFALSVALALFAFGLWQYLGHGGRTRLRALLFVPISVAIFFCHTFGWGMLGLLCFSAEAVRLHDQGRGWLRSGLHAALNASVMALPIVITIAWRKDVHGGMTFGWGDWPSKLRWLEMVLRDRWEWFDLASVGVVGIVLVAAVALRRLTFSRNLLFTALVLSIGFLILPRTVFGSTYADMRLLPFVLATAVLAIRFHDPADRRLGNVLAVAGLAFFAIRLAATTLSLGIAADDQQAKLAALDHVPMGARVISLVGYPCGKFWALPRDTHLGGMVIVRRNGFSNDQWTIEGANLLRLRYREAGIFAADPSQIVRSPTCRIPNSWTIDRALGQIRPGRFDYVWLIDTAPSDPRLLEGMTPVWRGPASILYRLQP